MLKYDARKAPDTPPSAAPTPYASSFVRTIGTPALAAAPSSSRSAIHALPTRESRSRKLTNSISCDEREGEPVPGTQVQRTEALEERQVDLVDGGHAVGSPGERSTEELDLPAVGRDLPDDLAERERDDADIVAAQAQRRHPDQHAGDRRRDDREHEDDQEVEVDSGHTGGRLADEERDAGAVRGVGPERGSEVRGDVRADREERHVAQVKQPGEAHDDVQAQRHDHVGRRQDQVFHRAAALAKEERQDGGEAEAAAANTRRALIPSGTAAPVVRAILRPIAADRHGAPSRRSVLRAVEERVLALATGLQA